MRQTGWLLFLALAFAPHPGAASARESVPQFHVGKCEECHGRDGNSGQSLVPRINGQVPHYIVRRLDQLSGSADGRHASLSGAHGDLSPSLKSEIAQYFAARTPTEADKANASGLGAAIYRDGIPGRNVAACSYCHGTRGQGDGPIPRLAGQHKAYLRIRLDLLSGILLQGSGAMHMAIGNVTPEEIDAITSYLAAR
ncbi:MAG TPA: c-type cytochrome [Rhizomicrobium sp.]|nr:c-type cytochrome [Rhizomicrobium sp.]